jgi:hypothetical protein
MKCFLLCSLFFVLVGCEAKDCCVPVPCDAGNQSKAILIRKGCESYVLQVETPGVKRQSDWKDIFSGKSHSNVVSVLNYCDDSPEAKILQNTPVGSTLLLDLNPTENKCLILCFAHEASPEPAYAASNISVCSSTGH